MYSRVIKFTCLLAILVNCVKAPNPPPNVCETDICKQEAEHFKKYIDETADPCENFYDFACGTFAKNTVLPKNKVIDMSISRVLDMLNQNIYDALSEKSQPNEKHAFKLAKDFLSTCMDTGTLNAAGTQPMLDILEKYGGWPVLSKGESEWKGDNWDWLKAKQQTVNDGFVDDQFDIILAFLIGSDDKNSSKRAIFIDRAEFGVQDEFLRKGLEDEKVKFYKNFMVDLAVLLGAEQGVAERDMNDAIDFEIKLAKNSLTDEARRDSKVTSNFFNMKTLQEQFPLLNWLDFINWNLKGTVALNDDDTITVTDVEYLHKLKELLDATPKRTIANYFGMRLVKFSSELLSDALHERFDQFEKENSGQQEPDSRSIECAKKTAKHLPLSTAAIYVRKYFDKSSKDEATQMAYKIKNAFIEMLRKTTWMDDGTRAKAIEKAEAMVFSIAYPDELTIDTKLEEYYRGLELQSNSLLHSVLNARKFSRDKPIQDFRKPIVKGDWRDTGSLAIQINAFYSGSLNAAVLTAGIIQGDLYQKSRSHFINYAMIGSILGHEVTHGYDDQGRDRDANGNLVDWWDKKTSDKFKEGAACFVQKYSEYKHPNATLNLKVNGANTQGENIADVGGMKAAYGAYQLFVEQNGAEPTLPGLDYTPNQLFWISAANTFCEKTRPEYDNDQYTTDPHSPNYYRVIGPMSSLSQFADDFKCKPGTAMNPTKKCEIW